MITLKFKNFVIIVAKMTDRKRTTRRDDEREEYIPADFWLWPVATQRRTQVGWLLEERYR